GGQAGGGHARRYSFHRPLDRRTATAVAHLEVAHGHRSRSLSWGAGGYRQRLLCRPRAVPSVVCLAAEFSALDTTRTPLLSIATPWPSVGDPCWWPSVRRWVSWLERRR
ncbi:unnamed protein product, partial [Scytosiphon promiscuus]